MRKGDRKFSKNKKAEILVRAAHESINSTAEFYEVSQRSIFHWRKEMENDEELAEEYIRQENIYENDLIAPTRLTYKQYLALARNLATKGDWKPGKLREVVEAIRTTGDMVISLEALQEEENDS